MLHKLLMRKFAFVIALAALPAMVFAEEVGLFFDNSVAQIKFAAGDVKAALELKGFTVKESPLTSLSGYANKKVVLALASNKTVTDLMGGTAPTGLGEQAYALRTTTTPQTSYWVLGGDANGAMYGGFQVTENIKINGFSKTYNMEESPFTKERGAKLNIPMDGRSPTYPGELKGDSFKRAIAYGWDLNFWKEWLDAKARNRYNMLSVWCDHPFTSMVKVPGYENCVLTDVQDADFKVIKTMTIDQKIDHWKQVMAYAHSRGFKFYLVNWNTWTWGCTNKYGITNESDNEKTMAYMAKSMTKLFETYPDLDGFGITSGEMMDGSNEQKEAFLWESYGKPVLEYAKKNTGRKITFIHRFYSAVADPIIEQFKPMFNQPNLKFSFSVKYSQAKMLSTTYPAYFTMDLDAVIGANLTTFLTLRTDDLSFLDWGDPTFARAYIKGIPNRNPDHRKFINGWYFGGDNWCPTRAWHVKDPARQNDLEATRNWYFDMVWGRLSYNPDVSDDVFKAAIKLKYPQIADENALFEAWRWASKAFNVGNEWLVGRYYFDYSYHPETQKYADGYRNSFEFSDAEPPPGSTLPSAIFAADSAKRSAERALALLNPMSAGGDVALQTKIKNIQALACLSLFVSEKLRGAYTTGATSLTAMGKAYCIWKNYAELMDGMHYGMYYQRTDPTDTWSSVGARVLYEFTDAGGNESSLDCKSLLGARQFPVFIDKKIPDGIRALAANAITLNLQSEKGFSVEIFKSNGEKVTKLSKPRNNKGVSRFVLGKKLTPGVYMIRLNNSGLTTIRKMNVVTK